MFVESEHPRDEDGKFTNKQFRKFSKSTGDNGKQGKYYETIDHKVNHIEDALYDKVKNKFIALKNGQYYYTDDKDEAIKNRAYFNANNKNIKRGLRTLIGERSFDDLEQKKVREFTTVEKQSVEIPLQERLYKKPTNKEQALFNIRNLITDKTFDNEGVYENNNIYTKYDQDKLENIIYDNLGRDNVDIDFSRQSEATYLTLGTIKNPISIRIGSHFKSGTSGYSDVYLDWRKYLTIKDFENDLKTIKEQVENLE